MADYIDREALRQELYDNDAVTFKGLRIINQFPAADVVPWEWLERYAHGRGMQYASGFVDEARKAWEETDEKD